MKNKKPPNAGRGRVRGVPNKTTGTVREILAAFVEKNALSAQADYDRVRARNPAKALEIFARIAEFVLPRLQRTELRLPSAPLPNEVTDPNEAASVYRQIMGDPTLDATDVQFAVPAPRQIEQEPIPEHPLPVEQDVPVPMPMAVVEASKPTLTPPAPVTPHVHIPLADSRCPRCRNLGVRAGMGEVIQPAAEPLTELQQRQKMWEALGK
jgi:hypothetical protein